MSQKVIVVEDDINIAELLRLYLEKDGFEVHIAHDGGAGLHLAETEKPDLVMLDLMLPVMDGWQVCKTLRKTSKVPIIMLTAKSEDATAGASELSRERLQEFFTESQLVTFVKTAVENERELCRLLAFRGECT